MVTILVRFRGIPSSVANPTLEERNGKSIFSITFWVGNGGSVHHSSIVGMGV